MRKWARISVPTFVCDRDEGAINNVSHKERRGKKRQGAYKNAVNLRKKGCKAWACFVCLEVGLTLISSCNRVGQKEEQGL